MKSFCQMYVFFFKSQRWNKRDNVIYYGIQRQYKISCTIILVAYILEKTSFEWFHSRVQIKIKKSIKA